MVTTRASTDQKLPLAAPRGGSFCHRVHSTTRPFRKPDVVAHPAPQRERRPGFGRGGKVCHEEPSLYPPPAGLATCSTRPALLAVVLVLLWVGDKHIAFAPTLILNPNFLPLSLYLKTNWPHYMASQTWTVLSILPEAMRLPSGDQATESIPSECPR